MHQGNDKDIKLLFANKLHKINKLVQFSTTRKGGNSSKPFDSFNLSLATDECKDIILANRGKLADLLGISYDKLIFPKQTHSAQIARIDKSYFEKTEFEKDIFLSDTDALITNEKGVCICVLTADCVPVFLFDPVREVVAVVHAGWRGTAGRIVKKAVAQMTEQYGCRSDDIIACIGPSIGPDAYETGEDVAGIFSKMYEGSPGVVAINPESGRNHVNLWEANRLQLLQGGCKPDNIDVSSICTWENHDTFYSSRKSGGRTGRFANGIMLI